MCGSSSVVDRPHRFPSDHPAIASFVEGGDIQRVVIGCSRASVSRITGPERAVLFLKSAPVAQCVGLIREAERLRWLDGKVNVPRVLSYLVEDDWEHLLMTGVP